MCHAVNFPHSAKTTVRKNVVATPRPLLLSNMPRSQPADVRVLHACIDWQQQQQQQHGEAAAKATEAAQSVAINVGCSSAEQQPQWQPLALA